MDIYVARDRVSVGQQVEQGVSEEPVQVSLERRCHLYLSAEYHLFSRSVLSDSLQPHGLQHARLPCPSPCSGVCSNSCWLSWWCHPTILSSVTLFSPCPQSFPASGSWGCSFHHVAGPEHAKPPPWGRTDPLSPHLLQLVTQHLGLK